IRPEEHQAVVVDQVTIRGIQHIGDPLGVFHIGAGHSGGGQFAELNALAFAQTDRTGKLVAAIRTTHLAVTPNAEKWRTGHRQTL
ncbi:hypothetical protein P8629_12320, partial [Hydrogenovibrio sp. 3SP14C1]